MVQSLCRTLWIFLKTLKIELPYDSATQLPSIYPEKKKTIIQTDTCTPMFIAPSIYNSHTWKQPKYPLTDEWVKMCCIYRYRYTHLLLSH